jgi:TetR/AcrR family transcriptional regulator
MGPKKTSRVEGEGRERILEVAIASFAERGYAGTTTAGVARDAGVTQPLVHHHFGSKDGLWRSAIDHLFAGLPELLEDLDVRAAAEDQLLALAEGFVRLSAARPAILRIIAREGSAPGPRLDYLLSTWVGAALQRAVEIIRKGQREGLVAKKVKPELLLFFALGAGGHLFDVPALAQRAFGIDCASPKVREDYVALVLQVLRDGAMTSTKGE